MVAVLELFTIKTQKMKLEYTNFGLPQNPPLFTENVVNRLSFELNKRFEDYIIEGLKRKGFEIENKIELENLINSNCRCEDRTGSKQRIYFVNDIPFFLHHYEFKMDLNPFVNDMGDVKILASYGSFAYL
jgi:hypothetical protein